MIGGSAQVVINSAWNRCNSVGPGGGPIFFGALLGIPLFAALLTTPLWWPGLFARIRQKFPIKFERETRSLLIWWLLTVSFSRKQLWLFDGRISLDWYQKNLWVGDFVFMLKTWNEYHRDQAAVRWGDVAFRATQAKTLGLCEVHQELDARRKAFFTFHALVLNARKANNK